MADIQDNGRFGAPGANGYNTTSGTGGSTATGAGYPSQNYTTPQTSGHSAGYAAGQSGGYYGHSGAAPYGAQAGYEQAGYDDEAVALGPQRPPMTAMVNIAGAVVSLGLLVGVGVWGYKLIVRDVSGVPVVRAAEGPMRVVPDDPGGQLAQNQGLSVNEVAASGASDRAADRVILAPKPLDLDAVDDMPALVVDQTGDQGPDSDTTNMSVEALVNELMAEAQPLGTLDTEEVLQNASLSTSADQPASNSAATEPAPVIKEIVGGMGRSLRPKGRPANLAELASLSPAPVAAAVLDVRADDLPVGTRLAQLGAYESEAVARKEWDRMAARFGDFMDGKQRVIQKAQSAGSTFYRLRVHGFADMGDARRFCAALQAEGAECISVSHK
ncbi:SPOR domain-containing protein [Thalassovita mediterranea]|uniref:Cell division protein FtsN n=1 Tax=Thalassovita mediterranea TaxID=340021 RepID=A0A0P1GMY7_9RHOB|nr:SPOR domain-containing protein [Thalassovita mediterranea]CUH83621.1 Cell division protein FtsN [Thalassovita mediterranea]SIS28839.1 Sporulation related domain-containing protein [Thalassovita mediterranea]